MIERWKPKAHYKAIASWYHARDLEAPIPDAIPDIGYIVDGKVAGWLHRTDTNMAIIDTYISNPHSTRSSRRHAVELLTATLLDAAGVMGCNKVICLVSIPDHNKLASKYNLKETGQQVFTLEESDEEVEDIDEYL